MAGYLGLFGYAGYCASKYAVIGFSQALRHELKPYGICVSVLCPPSTRTPGFEEENRLKPPEVLRMEEKAGTVEAQDVARALLRALPGRPFLIHPSLESRLIFRASRFLPQRVLDFLMRRPLL
jgi:3-dehydrosphinganine reductase